MAICEHTSHCPISQIKQKLPGGGSEYVNVCAGGQIGGCDPIGFEEIAEIDKEIGQLLGAPKRVEPLIFENRGPWEEKTPVGRSW